MLGYVPRGIIHRQHGHSEHHKSSLRQKLFLQLGVSFRGGLWALVWPELGTCRLQGAWNEFLECL